MQVRVREVVGTVRAVDGESLLSPQILEQIVALVLEAVGSARADADSRSRDTRIGGDTGCPCKEQRGEL